MKKKLIIIFLIIFILIFIISLINLILWVNDNQEIKNISNDLNDNQEFTEVEGELVNPPEDETSDYWYYVKFNLYDVDFNELLKKNDETIGWINVNNTNINYPIVQTDNNSYYLEHAYDKSKNEAGWVFLDYRNNNNFQDSNSIIYAHSRLDKSMFGSLSKVFKKSWYTNKDNHIIRLSTPSENTLWQIFSVYKIPEETYYIQTEFTTEDKYNEFLQTIKNRSIYDFNTELNSQDKIITLSTCYSETTRTVVHAKLIKKASK